MSGPLEALHAVSGLSPLQPGADVVASGAPPPAAGPDAAAGFARELAAAPEVPAAQLSLGQHVSIDMSERFRTVSEHMSNLDQSAHALQAGSDGGAAMSPAALMQELGRYSSLVFMATVTSNGASEGSKMFNTLLKGQ